MRNLVIGKRSFTREIISLLEHRDSQISRCDWPEAAAKVTLNHPDAIFLDLSDEASVRRFVRLHEVLKSQEGYAPMLVGLLPHETGPQGQIQFYNLGFDLVLEKPLEPALVVARMKAVDRRIGSANSVCKSKHLLLNIHTHDVFLQNTSGELYGHFMASPMQFAILKLLMERPRQIWSRDALDEALRPNFNKATDLRALDATVRRLRLRLEALLKKLPDQSWSIQSHWKDPFIHTEKGVGYFFEDRVRLAQEDRTAHLLMSSSTTQAHLASFGQPFPFNLQDASIAWVAQK